ncbi:triacylglycerol lipase [Halospina denitrificans]|uniref:Triacylglycerol lipase n=1 Tax=Halospina denitrificans TaxID=332522 RepID=A0A4R7JZK1_9GAMM|nr:triacylglycerol lipase [Halospina denitrificans]TDT43404.1 triacylglycerol lipase [Halospina denitrificans]
MRQFKLSLLLLCAVIIGAPSSALASYTDTKHPIVLVHGLAGFDTVGGLVNYFHSIPYQLERSGATVHTVSVSFVNDSWTRGEQLRDQLYALPGQKFNLIGHSQGSPTSRVAAHLAPEKVASVTSVNGVNKGSKVADVLRGVLPPDSSIEGGVSAIADAAGSLINELTGSDNPQDGVAALETLTTPGTNAINDATQWRGVNRGSCAGTQETYHINGHPVRYFSWGGGGRWTNALDATDPFLVTTGLVFNQRNDGLVSTCSMKLGNVIGTHYTMNHIDAVNHLFGLRSIWTNPVSLYRSHANRLKNRGL